MNQNPILKLFDDAELKNIQILIDRLCKNRVKTKEQIDHYTVLFNESGYNMTTSASEKQEDRDDQEKLSLDLGIINKKIDDLEKQKVIVQARLGIPTSIILNNKHHSVGRLNLGR